jgi:hypothetical protein
MPLLIGGATTSKLHTAVKIAPSAGAGDPVASTGPPHYRRRAGHPAGFEPACR